MEPEPDSLGSEDVFGSLTEPSLATFSAHLPFVLGIPDNVEHMMSIGIPWSDPGANLEFGENGPWVRIRLCNIEEAGLPLWPTGVNVAMGKFYNHSEYGDENVRIGEDTFASYEQWITLETPIALSKGDDPADSAYLFHRSMYALNIFLRAVIIATRDFRIRPISTQDLRPCVLVGALNRANAWQPLIILQMHPEARPESLMTGTAPANEVQLRAALLAMINDAPYLRTALWRSRAQRSVTNIGDATDAIISFQIAAESLLFDTYRMIMIDEGLTEQEVNQKMAADIPFKTLLTSILPSKLGGQWDVTQSNSPVGIYWNKLYLLRNSVIHAGSQPHNVDAQEAEKAYQGLRVHLESRLWAKHKIYPRTFLCRLGPEGIAANGWSTNWIREYEEKIKSEPSAYYWPWDKAGRSKPSNN